MKRTFNTCVILLTVLLACYYVNANHLVKRDDDNKSILDTLKDFLGGLPIVGGLISDAIQKIQDIYNKLQELTNGAFGRLLGGAFPCTIAIGTGVTCTGVTTQSSLSDLFKDLLEPLPSLMLPDFVKKIIYMSADGLLVPLVDVLFGGRPVEDG
ncbi:hypothetical protein PV325_003425 [Microctonus aethiopoides]|uniref:Uncharacterized protein n=1 Tax=Microctonus aethiopoides TaxID=144406 RepID=A0AA39FRC8_9HYME|nr:hypothetical protein PV325_003425 [Microctonus aethiopoides]KAK0174201.1 hypothetical protein PV328_007310 [Microctonus aethiopoides]